MLAAPAEVSAQSVNDPVAPCRPAGTTYATVQCLDAALRLEDQALGALSTRIAAVLDGHEKARYNAAERDWGAYRVSFCDAEYRLYGGGTGGPPTRLACQWALARDHVTALHRSYDWVLSQREARPR